MQAGSPVQQHVSLPALSDAASTLRTIVEAELRKLWVQIHLRPVRGREGHGLPDPQAPEPRLPTHTDAQSPAQAGPAAELLPVSPRASHRDRSRSSVAPAVTAELSCPHHVAPPLLLCPTACCSLCSLLPPTSQSQCPHPHVHLSPPTPLPPCPTHLPRTSKASPCLLGSQTPARGPPAPSPLCFPSRCSLPCSLPTPILERGPSWWP